MTITPLVDVRKPKPLALQFGWPRVILQPIECHRDMEEYSIPINGIDGFFRDHLIDSPAKTYHKTLHLLWPCRSSQHESL